MTGFKDEAQLWKYQKPRLVGHWDRYECVTPAGHPDVKGSFEKQLHYIENKVGSPSLSALEPSQVTYIKWLLSCRQNVWLCFGSKTDKALEWYTLHVYDDGKLSMARRFLPPPFWKGKA